ncbi:D-alanyl-D-alanine carboxypeptidase/D-alanyl-D-alanine-endopeptidase [Deinococcus humi]|uniref:D-alanyl-D-alanine carboxypeptidase/D-alanyl-D-alanine-endopeptidase (Penicillin-binding protein 4) n=1 Tax=Deinococcus humi TaxID=662880 RepID=A0A7W8NG27_9DEIO|nr:D-alanyl-D-alanine carboxypeptidase [Deinococcus humi]MBB5365026.1 D-alanyl-D-alanine carboxypeptidase/D-alanyl-D-alanine-endopeptidase (penicillin-binding protein 4) [Deinococcus humi]GGO34788.1 D-alanyl-D-alanine carboxypeptidase [Deinococcus humi]
MRRTLPLLCLLLCLGGAPFPAAQAPDPQAADLTLQREPGLSEGVRRVLRGLPPGVRAGVLVQDLQSGQVLQTWLPDTPFIPASTNKLVVGAAVLNTCGGADGWWSSELTVPAAQVGRPRVKAVTLRGSGDPTLKVSEGPYSLRALAKQAYGRGLRVVGEVRLDDARLDSGTWKDAPIEVPMTALRLAEWHDAPPLSQDTARRRLGAALIAELRRAGIRVTSQEVGKAASFKPYLAPARTDERGETLPPDPVTPVGSRPEQAVASVRSAPVAQFLADTLRPSDNLNAEELLATLALRPAGNGTLEGALARERAFLGRIGVDLSGVVLADGSGLSREGRLTPRALVELLRTMYELPYPLVGTPAEGSGFPDKLYRQRQNAFVEALPQGGTDENLPNHGGRGGTLSQRFVGTGLDVRAKTGTLPGVSSLAGYVTAKSGHLLAFALMMNGPPESPILTLRALQDEVVAVLAAEN